MVVRLVIKETDGKLAPRDQEAAHLLQVQKERPNRAMAAEQDADFLESCFVDTGAYTLVKDANDHRVILVGRTGTGKSALLQMLEQDSPRSVVRIVPETLALTYVSNSTILNFFAQIGVNLDPSSSFFGVT